jgi:hypothetical protein
MSARAAWRLEAAGFSPVYDYVAGKSDYATLPTWGGYGWEELTTPGWSAVSCNQEAAACDTLHPHTSAAGQAGCVAGPPGRKVTLTSSCSPGDP